MGLSEASFVSVPARLRAAATAFPDRMAVCDEQSSLTYHQLREATGAAADKLARAGVIQGDVVAICAFNSVSYVIAYLGAVGMGAVVAPLPQSATADRRTIPEGEEAGATPQALH